MKAEDRTYERDHRLRSAATREYERERIDANMPDSTGRRARRRQRLVLQRIRRAGRVRVRSSRLVDSAPPGATPGYESTQEVRDFSGPVLWGIDPAGRIISLEGPK